MKIYQYNSINPISDEFFNLIISQLEQYYCLSSAFKAKFRSILSQVSYKKGSHILNTGARQDKVWFVLDGLLQEITVDRLTFDTTTTWFWFGFSMVYAAPGFFDQEPSQVTINVVKDSVVAFISYDDWKILKENYDETDKLIEILRTNYEMARKLHLNDINNLNTNDRYLKCESKINQLVQHIQLKHIAEYTGMSTDTLGKLRRKYIKEKQVTV